MARTFAQRQAQFRFEVGDEQKLTVISFAFSSTCLSLPRKPWRTGSTRSSLRMVGTLRSTAKTTRRMALFLAVLNARQEIEAVRAPRELVFFFSLVLA
jgi:hypothetical protein